MKKFIVALCLLATPALAQQPPQLTHIDKALIENLGQLQFNNTIMGAEIKRLVEENLKLHAELNTLKKEKGDAQQESKAGTNDGSGRP